MTTLRIVVIVAGCCGLLFLAAVALTLWLFSSEVSA